MRSTSQFWGGWNDDYAYRRRGPAFQSGGERPDITPLEPKTISFPSKYPVGSIVIDTKGRQLLLVKSETEALHYPISVGREGFTWTGTETISRKNPWPDWYPPDEMRARDWQLPEKMSGGVKNPLGAMALYLGSSLYRIHGTNDAKSIGRAASSGCFRMLNGTSWTCPAASTSARPCRSSVACRRSWIRSSPSRSKPQKAGGDAQEARQHQRVEPGLMSLPEPASGRRECVRSEDSPEPRTHIAGWVPALGLSPSAGMTGGIRAKVLCSRNRPAARWRGRRSRLPTSRGGPRTIVPTGQPCTLTPS